MRNFDEIIDVEAIPRAIEKEVPVEEVDRIPGKIAVVAFSALLVLGLISVVAIGLQFQTIMNRLDASRSAWPEASKELAQRFDQAEQYLASVDYLGNSPTLLDWRYHYSQFSESRQFDRQVIPATKLADILEALLSQRTLPPTSPTTSNKAGRRPVDSL